jgi:(E)-4-hydroxy-3-methylbut-2-enyl-diphosphate synthase
MHLTKRKSHIVKVGNVLIGHGLPIVVQSMTNTPTSDVNSTIDQIQQLYEAGSEIVRVTVNNDLAAKAIPKITEGLEKRNINIPLVGCFHYNGHILLTNYPECASALAKYRVNPGNLGVGIKHDLNFETIVKIAIKNDKSIRIGANWGSLDQRMLAKLMDENALSSSPLPISSIEKKALISSVLESAKTAENIGLSPNKIIVSCKVSNPLTLIEVYQELAGLCPYPLHLGLTEAGIGLKSIVSTTAALAPLLLQGIGDTIRCSLTPNLNEDRTLEVRLCQEILQSLQLRNYHPEVTSCPGCGRTSSNYFQYLASEIDLYLKSNIKIWKQQYKEVENLKVAVMGCIVNGPGESKHADIGISLPGSGENPSAPVFINGRKTHTLKGDTILEEFQSIIENYVITTYNARS